MQPFNWRIISFKVDRALCFSGSKPTSSFYHCETRCLDFNLFRLIVRWTPCERGSLAEKRSITQIVSLRFSDSSLRAHVVFGKVGVEHIDFSTRSFTEMATFACAIETECSGVVLHFGWEHESLLNSMVSEIISFIER